MESLSKTEKALLGIILFVINFVISGFVTIYLWNNIMCKLFELRMFTFWQGWVFGFIIRWFIPKVSQQEKELTEKLLGNVIYTLLVWLVGFLAVQFIVF